ncbi:hypothetical protein SAMN05428989_0552 [Pseudoxanthomonas sp. GM95]|uniref:hypothetical protein n=1 Tax=Pseudoxanthomonas sp. GM95 TaxID=1881043 RepID=UPI0008B8A287|nr:hypothetical protein [Pseudoxanthomonas sp. GM95]SEK65810.1 hypothetical protein SAMN05428989_0552 [Pseudoxanthomonas sp. GM95]
MIVPEYWAEARLHTRNKGRSVTVRRFGWSDAGQAEAEAHAQARVQEAFDRIVSGEKLPRRELRSNYGIHGVPIREQIVERHDGVVITRNSYGALCLNTPDVLFADVDFDTPPRGCGLTLGFSAVMLVAGFVLGAWQRQWLAGIAAACIVLLIANFIALRRKRRQWDKDGGPQARALARIEAFSNAHPDWHLRVYRSPAGLRVLAMQRTFAPDEAAVADCFHALGADQLYATLCKVQHCFRARLTGKPWRMGITRRIRPTVAAWSSEQAQRPERLAWIADYERVARDFAACHYLQSLGDVSKVDPRAEQVRALHDAMTRAGSDLPLA